MQLSQERFQSARNYIKNHARPVDCALFEYRFENGTANKVVESLKAYQNSDGGFGQSLEPDLRSPSSSGLATAHAFDILREVDCHGNSQIIFKTVRFVLETFRSQTKVWPVAPDDVNEYPHAPWWHDENGSLERVFDGFQIIPRALILASLYSYQEHLPAGWLAEVSADIMHFIGEASVDVLGSDSFVWAGKLAQADGIPPAIAEKLKGRLLQILSDVVSTNPEEWSEYCLPPLKAAPGPESLAAPHLADAI